MARAGIENRNPLNVKQDRGARGPWNGSTGEDGRDHVIFCSPEYGLRAAIRTIAKKFKYGPISTLELIALYTDDPTENDVEAYAAFVAGKLHRGVEEDLYIFDQAGNIEAEPELRRLIRAMAMYETGAGLVICQSVLESAIWLYRADFNKE